MRLRIKDCVWNILIGETLGARHNGWYTFVRAVRAERNSTVNWTENLDQCFIFNYGVSYAKVTIFCVAIQDFINGFRCYKHYSYESAAFGAVSIYLDDLVAMLKAYLPRL